ncbi:TRAP transporter small permease [Amorphus coralli]|uniref:TRAP transporter small permease n=1 Tax=Amorphus coralli TaxID=340680 RepID=UPI000413A461|nr:TRAP transporter small permease [Amorphus coralli]
MSMVRKCLDLSETALMAICIAMFAVMVALGIATVFFRFVVESSLAFPDELIRYLFIWLVFLGAAIALRRNSHAAIGVLVEYLPAPLKRGAVMLASLASAAFFAVLIVKGIELTERVGPQISPALEVSMAWVYAAVPVSGVFLLVYTLEILAWQRSAPADKLSTLGN